MRRRHGRAIPLAFLQLVFLSACSAPPTTSPTAGSSESAAPTATSVANTPAAAAHASPGPLDLGPLAADGVREFALVLTHPKLRGATGAWTSPIALV